MKSNSSPNDIPSKFLKIASCIVSEWLFKLFNKCMTTGDSRTPGKLPTSLQFLKFIAQVPHLNIDPVVGLGLGGPEARLKRGPSDDVIIFSQP